MSSIDLKYSASRQYIWILRLFSISYVVVGAIFLFESIRLIEIMNEGAQLLSTLHPHLASLMGAPMPLPAEKFYVVLTTAMMVMLATTAILGSRSPSNKGYFLIHILSKVTSIIGFVAFFLQFKQFPYAIGAIVDSWVLLVISVFFLRAVPYMH